MGIALKDLPDGARQQAAAILARDEARRHPTGQLDLTDPRTLDLLDGGGMPEEDIDPALAEKAAMDAWRTSRPKALFDPPPKPNAAAKRKQHREHGQRAVKQGSTFENEVERAVRSMRQLGIADLSRNRPGWRVIREQDHATGKWKVKDAMPVAKGTVDLEGCVRGGRFVRVELKTAKGSRMNLGSYVSDGEAAALDRAVQFGALAFLLVKFMEAPERWYLFPWSELRDVARAEYREKSVIPDQAYLAEFLFLNSYAGAAT